MAKTKHELPTTAQGLAKEADKVRAELATLRRDHALQKLDSPAKLRQSRVRLARILTMQRAGANQPAVAPAPAKSAKETE